VLTVTPADQVFVVGLVGVAAVVHEAVDATDQTVSEVAAASVALPEARVNVAVMVCDWALVVLVVFVIVMLPVEVSELLLVTDTFSLPRVVVAHPVAVALSVAAPAPSVAVPVADQ
jgi:hypothetical protein